jgi:hypothetical protein
MFCTRRFLAPDSQILHQTCHVLHHSHSWNYTVVVGPRRVTVSNRQSRFTPDSCILHHTVAFCTRKSHLAPDSRNLHQTVTFCTIVTFSTINTQFRKSCFAPDSHKVKMTVGTIQSLLTPDSYILVQIVKNCTRPSHFAPDSHMLHQTVTFCTRQSRFEPWSHSWHQTVTFCTG